MVHRLQEIDLIITHQVNDAMFLRQSSRPGARMQVLKRLRLANPLKRISEDCVQHKAELTSDISAKFDSPNSPEIYSDYFLGSDAWKNDRPPRAGYYVGAELIRERLAAGDNICDLACKSAAYLFSQ